MIKVLFFLRRVWLKIFRKKKEKIFSKIKPQYTNEESSILIFNLLNSNKPCMISRFGNNEINCAHYYKIKNYFFLKKYYKFFIGDIDAIEYPKSLKKRIKNNAGFFPVTDDYLDKFCQQMLKDIKNIDILGSWLYVEENFQNELKNAKTVDLEDLNPYNHTNPWSKVLKGKKVLVIHPFINSISKQYKKRELLFKNKEVLPEFDLITYKPVVSFAGNDVNVKYNSWFEALEDMKKDISEINFDIALIGCGAYGLPLASYVKNIGKKSVHLGGATQMLFGIKGKRWENEYELNHLFNKFWVRPSLDEIPNNAKQIEKGCYW
jgi:hypothetical protein